MSLPWMPLDVAAYRKDTAHLDASEHGAYLLLIMHYWAAGALPEDDRQLARIAAMTPAQWRRSKSVLQAFFYDGWKHKRIDKELARAAEISSKRAAAAQQRHSKQPANAHANAHANAEQMDTHARTCASALPPPPQSPREENSSLRSEARKRASRLPADWRPNEKDFEYAHAKGLQHGRIAAEAEKFRNYWTAKGGKDAAKLDWAATWRNWILNVIEREGKSHANGRRSVQDAAADLVDRVQALVEPSAPALRDGTGEGNVRLLPAR